MKCSRPSAWLFALSLGGLAAGSSGCTRPSVAPVAESLTAAEPAPPSASDADKTPADDKKEADGPAFHFPEDAGGALLSRVLPPADVKGPLDEPNPGPRRPAPALSTAGPPCRCCRRRPRRRRPRQANIPTKPRRRIW